MLVKQFPVLSLHQDRWCLKTGAREKVGYQMFPALWVYPQFRPHSDSGQVHSDSDQIPYRILIRMVFCTEIKSPALGMAPECRCAAPPRLCSGRASAQTLRGGQGGAGAQGSSAWALARPEQSSGTAIRHADGLSDQNPNASLNGF